MKIVVTLDYELFLNDISGSVTNCLVRPMIALNDICQRHDVKLSVFVDMAYIYRLSELKGQFVALHKDFDDVIENVKFLHDQGHDIQLHLHPQWFYSTYNGWEWVLDFAHYKLSDMPGEDAWMKFQKCKEMLEEIVEDRVIAFRAGGYSIQGYTLLGAIMRETGVLIDSSVLFGASVKSAMHDYDYRNVPDKPVYRFQDDVAIQQEDGDLLEVPIQTIKIPILKYLIRKRHKMKLYEINNQCYGDGGNKAVGKIQKIKNIASKMAPSMRVSGNIDYQSFFFLNMVFNEHLGKNNKELFTIMGHPKNFSKASLDYFEEFIKCQKQNVEFVSISELINESKI